MINYSVVIPVYNTTKVLFDLQQQINKVFQSMDESYELIFVNDHSPKKETWEVLKEISNAEHTRAINLTRNFGQQAATLCGLACAKGTYIITMDDDLQHNPEDIPKLAKLREHAVVVAHFKNKKHNTFKKITSLIKERFDRIIFNKPKGIQLSAFRLINRNVVSGMLKVKTPTPFITALLFYVTKDVVGVEVEHNKRAEGASGYSFLSLVKLFSYLLINNSSLLLRVIGRFGVIIFLLSFAWVLYLLYNYFFHGFVLGWTSTMVAIIMFGGIQLFTLGIIGEYLIRIINYSEQKPPYLIKEILE